MTQCMSENLPIRHNDFKMAQRVCQTYKICYFLFILFNILLKLMTIFFFLKLNNAC